MPAKNSPENTADREFVNMRVFDAPRELVFKVWTDPVHIAKWWGPNGFTNTVHEMSVKPGGVFRFIMHGPDGTNFPSKIVYTKVVANERLEFEYSDEVENAAPPFLVTVMFEEVSVKPAKTKVTMRMVVATAAMAEEIRKSGAVEGGKQTFDRMAEYLKVVGTR